MGNRKGDVLRGTLDLMILQSLASQPMHGYGIARRIEDLTGGEFGVSPGSFFPALYRLESRGWVRGSWGSSDNGRRARYYSLTPAGRRQLGVERRHWDRIILAIDKLLHPAS
jgi:transcriptional regulator